MSDSPVAILFDVNGNPIATEANPLVVTGAVETDVNTSTLATHAKQDEQTTELQAIKTAVESVNTKFTNPLPVTGSITATVAFPEVQPVSDNNASLTVDSPQLPAALVGGKLDVAATIQGTPNVTVSNQPADPATETTLATRASEATLADVKTAVESIDTKLTNPLPISGTVAATVAGVATAANQATEIASLASIDGKTPALASGRVPVDGSGVTQPVSAATLPLPAGAATAAAQATAQASLTSIDSKLTSPITVTGTVTTAPNASVGTTGSAVPASATSVGGQDASGNLRTVRVFDADLGGGAEYLVGAVLRKSASGGSVEAGTASDPLRIDPTGTTTQPVSAASLPLPSGAATAAKQIDPVQDGAAYAGTEKGPLLHGADASSIVRAIKVDNTGAQAIYDNGSSLTTDTPQLPAALVDGKLATIDPDYTASGIIDSVNDIVQIGPMHGAATGSVALTGTWTGASIWVEQSSNGSDWYVGSVYNGGASDSVITSSSQGVYAFIPAGLPYFRLRCSAFGTGSINVLLKASTGTGWVRVAAPLPAGTHTIGKVELRSGFKGATLPAEVTSTSGGSDKQGLDVAIMGSNGNNAAVKPASTAAVASDPALVVAVSPNNTVAVTDNSGSLTVDTPQLPSAVGQNNKSNSLSVTLAGDHEALPVSFDPNYTEGDAEMAPSGEVAMVWDGGTVRAALSDSSGRLFVNVVGGVGLTNGTAKTIARGGAKGSTTAADVTSTASGSNHQAMDVVIYDTSGNAITNFAGTQYADGAAVANPTGTVAMGSDGALALPLLVDSTGRTVGYTPDASGSVTLLSSSTASSALDSNALLATGRQARTLFTGGAENFSTVKVQGSFDNTNWIDLTSKRRSNQTSPGGTVNLATAQDYVTDVSQYRYVRYYCVTFAVQCTLRYTLSDRDYFPWSRDAGLWVTPFAADGTPMPSMSSAATHGFVRLTDGSSNAAVMASQSPALPTSAALVVDVRPSVANYYSASNAPFSPPATPSDVALITGSASKTVRVLRMTISTTQTTAGVNTWYLIKRSTANSGGTSTTATDVAHDSNYTSPTAVVRTYTANPTTGSAVGNVAVRHIFSSTTTTQPQAFEHDFTNGGLSKGLVLRGTAQSLALNFNGAALPAGLSVSCTFEWVEE